MAKSLIAAALRLADVLDRENMALREMDLRRAAALLPEKTVAIADLTASVAATSSPAPPALAPAARKVEVAMLENRRLLERAIVVQNRVIGIVARAAVGAADSSYGARGRYAAAKGPMAFSTRA